MLAERFAQVLLLIVRQVGSEDLDFHVLHRVQHPVHGGANSKLEELLPRYTDPVEQEGEQPHRHARCRWATCFK
jgi:hypothetical protein